MRPRFFTPKKSSMWPLRHSYRERGIPVAVPKLRSGGRYTNERKDLPKPHHPAAYGGTPPQEGNFWVCISSLANLFIREYSYIYVG
jgi:hypothetical protein